MKHLKTSVAGLALISGLVFATGAWAQNVTLKSSDGTVNLSGELIEFDGEAYTLRTELGDLSVAASRVRCEGDGCPSFEDVTADVVIAGSDSIGLGMMPLLMTGYAASLGADAELRNTAEGQALATIIGEEGFGDEVASYLVTATNDKDAFDALLDGSANVGMSSRRIEKNEARALRSAGAGSMISPNQEHIIAVDSMVVAAHASNPVDQLSIDQLRGIFSGKITNWSEIGGPDRDINVIVREDDTASYDFFMTYLFGEDRPDFLPQGIAKDDQDLSNVVYNDRNAIGYLGYAFQRGAKPITVVNECGIPTKPDAFSAKTEEYALNRRMYLYNRADNLTPQSKEFIDFVTSAASDNVISKSGFIDLGVTRRAQDATDARSTTLSAEVAKYGGGYEIEVMREMLESMGVKDRLSTTFRFRTGSSRVDERGKIDMRRLVEYLESAPAGAEVTFVGFTDDVGAFDSNRNLSFSRAAEVLDFFQEAAGERLGHVEMKIAGYGEIAPSACNASVRGRAINRRVEVWISDASAS